MQLVCLNALQESIRTVQMCVKPALISACSVRQLRNARFVERLNHLQEIKSSTTTLTLSAKNSAQIVTIRTQRILTICSAEVVPLAAISAQMRTPVQSVITVGIWTPTS